MADSKLIFPFKFPNWISTASFFLFCWTRLKCCFFPVPVPKLMASAPFSSSSFYKRPCPPHAGSLVPLRCYSKVMALTCQYKKFSLAPHGPLSAFIAAGQREAL